MPPKRQSGGRPVDGKHAYDSSLEYKCPEIVFLGEKMYRFLKAKGVQFAVQPQMMLPSLLVSTSNMMNMASLEFTKTWNVTTNIFCLVVANKGTGKTPSAKEFFGPLTEVEEDEMKKYKGEDKKKKRGGGKDTRALRKKFRKTVETGDLATEPVDEDTDENAGTEENVGTEEGTDEGDVIEENVQDEGIDKEPKQDEDENSGFKFHPKQRIVDGITPEALIKCLDAGSGVLVIKSDEYKGFFDRFIEAAHNESALCSAYSGEPIKYTTIKHGGITINENRLSIFGAIQPGPLFEIINGGTSNKKDDQGHWDRYILIPAGEDPDVDFADQLMDIDDQDKLDIKRYLEIINKNHSVPRKYTFSLEDKEKFIFYKGKLKDIDRQSNFGNETGGMTAKLFTNLQKVATIAACVRETLEEMENSGPQTTASFRVKGVDIDAAWEIIMLSMNTFKNFKPEIAMELGEIEADEIDSLLEEEGINEDLLFIGAKKIKQIFDKATNGEILQSIMKRDGLYPKMKGVNEEVFVRALVKFGLATTEQRVMKNRRPAVIVKLKYAGVDEGSSRVFRLLYQSLRAKSIVFDPLGIFHNGEE